MDESTYEEKQTPKGFLIKIRPDGKTYVVFTPTGPETPRGAKNDSIIVKVPRVAFVGDSFDVSHFEINQINYVNVKNSKMVIPYARGNSREIKSIFLNSGSASDILPVIVSHFNSVSEMLEGSEANSDYNHLLIDEEFPRSEMIKLKIRRPLLNILIIKKKITPKIAEAKEELNTDNIIDANSVRALDVAGEGNLNMFSGNPVFLSRIHLRNMDLDKVKQLLLDFNLTSDDVIFIRTFLGVMIKNENNKVELKRNQQKLIKLDRSFYLASLILGDQEKEFEIELKNSLEKEHAFMMYALLEKEQEREADIKKHLLLWEWKLRAKKMANGV